MFAHALTEVRAQATPWGIWPGDLVPTYAGPPVTPEGSLQLLTVYGCVRLISDSISTLPIDTYRELPDGTHTEFAKPDWLINPTVDLNFSDWCSQVLSSLLLQGNAYIWITRNDRGQIVELIPLNPSKVTVSRVKGRKTYTVNGALFLGEMLHIKGLMLPGADVGYSPLEAARQSVGLGLAAQEFGAKQFDGAYNMDGVIEIPKPIDNPLRLKSMAEVWAKKRNKRHRGLPGILDDGATWKPTGVTNEQAQFLQTRNFTAAEIAGQMFLVDPSDLGIPVQGTSLTYANLSERNTRRVQVTLMQWMIRIEAAISGLLSNPRFMKFNVNALLRGDAQQRSQYYLTMAQINAIAKTIGMPPVMLTSEMRAFEDFAPITETKAEDAATVEQLSVIVKNIFHGSGVILTPEEIRNLMNRVGAGLPAGFAPTAVPAPGGANDATT